jgi:hypothetical protein
MFNGATSFQQFLQGFMLETSQETFIKFDPVVSKEKSCEEKLTTDALTED